MSTTVRVDSGSQLYNPNNTSHVSEPRSDSIEKPQNIDQTNLLVPVYDEILQGDIFSPQVIPGGDNIDRTNLTNKVSNYSHSKQLDSYAGGSTNPMVSVLLFMLDKLFRMFSELEDEQFQQNGQLRLANADIANFMAEIGMEFALKSYEESKKAAFIEMGAAIAGIAISLAGTAFSVGSIAKSNTSEIDKLEANVTKVDSNSKILDKNKELFTGNESKYKQLKDYADTESQKTQAATDKKYTEFTDKNQENIDKAYKNILDSNSGKGNGNDVIKGYNEDLAKLKTENSSLFDKDQKLATPKNEELDIKINAVFDQSKFTPKDIMRGQQGDNDILESNLLTDLKQFTGENNQIGVFSNSGNKILLPDQDFDASGKFKVYSFDEGALVENATFTIKKDSINDFKNLYTGTARNGLNDIAYMNKNADKLASVLKASNADATFNGSSITLDKFKDSAKNTYTTLNSAESERVNIDKVKDSFKDAKASESIMQPAGKLKAEVDKLRQKRMLSSQNFGILAQTITSFSTGFSGLIRVFADLENAKAQLSNNEKSIFTDMITSLIQGIKETTDAVAANLRDILANVAKILEFYTSIVEATKVN